MFALESGNPSNSSSQSLMIDVRESEEKLPTLPTSVRGESQLGKFKPDSLIEVQIRKKSVGTSQIKRRKKSQGTTMGETIPAKKAKATPKGHRKVELRVSTDKLWSKPVNSGLQSVPLHKLVKPEGMRFKVKEVKEKAEIRQPFAPQSISQAVIVNEQQLHQKLREIRSSYALQRKQRKVAQSELNHYLRVPDSMTASSLKWNDGSMESLASVGQNGAWQMTKGGVLQKVLIKRANSQDAKDSMPNMQTQDSLQLTGESGPTLSALDTHFRKSDGFWQSLGNVIPLKHVQFKDTEIALEKQNLANLSHQQILEALKLSSQPSNPSRQSSLPQSFINKQRSAMEIQQNTSSSSLDSMTDFLKPNSFRSQEQSTFSFITQPHLKQMKVPAKQGTLKYKFLIEDSMQQLQRRVREQRHQRRSNILQKVMHIREQKQTETAAEIERFVEHYGEEVKVDNKDFLKVDVRIKNPDGQRIVKRDVQQVLVGCEEEPRAEFDETTLQQLRSLVEARKEMLVLDRKIVKESAIPLEVLYNDKITRIRETEQNRIMPERPIVFDINEGSVPTIKLIQINSESVPKPFKFRLDLAERNRQIFFESEKEKKNRLEEVRQTEAKKLGKTTKQSLYEAFVISLNETLAEMEAGVTHLMTKQRPSSRVKTNSKAVAKLEQMRTSNHYDLYRLEKTEIEDKNPQQRALEFALAFKLKLAQKGFHMTSGDSSSDKDWSTPRNPLEDSMSSVTENMSSIHQVNPKESIISQIQNLKRQGTLIFSGGVTEEMQHLRETSLQDYEVNYGLTKAQKFESVVQLKQQLKQQWLDDSKPLSVLQGTPPPCERLVWLVRDFMLATADFELNEKISWSQAPSQLVGGMVPEKSAVLLKLMKELFKKYQLAVFQPNVDYVLKKQCRLEEFGARRSSSQVVLDLPKLPESQRSRTSFRHKTQISAGPAKDSILHKFVAESRKITAKKFDHIGTRRKIIAESSMFKSKPNYRSLFANQNLFLQQLMNESSPAPESH